MNSLNHRLLLIIPIIYSQVYKRFIYTIFINLRPQLYKIKTLYTLSIFVYIKVHAYRHNTNEIMNNIYIYIYLYKFFSTKHINTPSSRKTIIYYNYSVHSLSKLFI